MTRTPVPGVKALVHFGRVALGQGDGEEPQQVRHAKLGLVWAVTAVLEAWERPEPMSQRYGLGEPATTARYVLRVHGPLPGKPAELGEFVMEVRRFGDRPGWWITVGE